MRLACRLSALFGLAATVVCACASVLPPTPSLAGDGATVAAQSSSSRQPRRAVRLVRVPLAVSSKQQPEWLRHALGRRAARKTAAHNNNNKHSKNRNKGEAGKRATGWSKAEQPLTGGEVHRRRRGAPDQGVVVDKSQEAPWYSFSFHAPDGGLHYNNGNAYPLGYAYRDGHRYRNRPRGGNSFENREHFHYKDGNYYAYF